VYNARLYQTNVKPLHDQPSSPCTIIYHLPVHGSRITITRSTKDGSFSILLPTFFMSLFVLVIILPPFQFKQQGSRHSPATDHCCSSRSLWWLAKYFAEFIQLSLNHPSVGVSLFCITALWLCVFLLASLGQFCVHFLQIAMMFILPLAHSSTPSTAYPRLFSSPSMFLYPLRVFFPCRFQWS